MDKEQHEDQDERQGHHDTQPRHRPLLLLELASPLVMYQPVGSSSSADRAPHSLGLCNEATDVPPLQVELDDDPAT